MMARSTRSLIGCTMVVCASACGGGGGGGGQGGNALTQFSIDFPPAHSMTSADTVTLKGSTTNGSDIASLQVNSVQAATKNGFDTWTATVPLPVAANALSAVAIDRSGRAIGPIEDAFAAGDFRPLREWLGENVHLHGQRYTVADLIGRATGYAPDPSALIYSLYRRYRDLSN